jgi:fructose/tagatose bisphosphate aldolase
VATRLDARACWTTPPRHGYGIPAFNVNNLEQVQAIMEAADETDSPVILQASRRRAQVRRRALPAAPDPGGRRDLSRTSRW